MDRVIEAVVENGLLRPEPPLDLPSGTRVRLTLEAAEADEDADWQELEKLWQETHIGSGGPHLTRDQLHERS